MADGASTSRFPVVVEAANETKRKPVLCHDTGPCWRWKVGKLEPCAGLCARRAYFDGLQYEVTK